MPRQAGLDVLGALHHIMVRGTNKSAIFQDDLEVLGTVKREPKITEMGLSRALGAFYRLIAFGLCNAKVNMAMPEL